MAFSLQDLESQLSGDFSLQDLEANLDSESVLSSTQQQDVDSVNLIDPIDFYSTKLKAIADAPSETIKRTKNLFDTGHPILGTLSALEYPFSNIFEAVNQFVGEPLSRQAKGLEALSGLPDLYSAPSPESINLAAEIFGPAGISKLGVKAGLEVAGINLIKKADKRSDIDFTKGKIDSDEVAFDSLRGQSFTTPSKKDSVSPPSGGGKDLVLIPPEPPMIKDMVPLSLDVPEGEFLRRQGALIDDVVDLKTGRTYDMGVIHKSPNHRSVWKQMTKDTADFLYRGSVEYLDELAEFSPTAKNLRNLIKTPIVAQTLNGADYMEAIRLQKGKFELRLSDILQDKRNNIKLVSGALPDELNDQVVNALRTGKPGNIPNVERVSGQIKTLLNDVGRYVQNSGIDISLIDNFFPRRYKIKDDESLIPAFIDLLESHGKSNERIKDIIYNIQNNNGFPLLGRTLDDIPDTELAPFLENNIAKVLFKYIDTVVNVSEFNRMFGKASDIALTKDIIKGEALRNKYPVSSEQLNREITRIDDILKAFKHQYHPITSKAWQAANNSMATFQYLRTLNYSLLSNLSEGFLGVYHSGLGNTLYTTLVPGIDHILRQSMRTVFKDFPKAQVTREFEELAGTIEQHGTDILQEMFNTNTRIGDIGFKATGLTQLTNFNKVVKAKQGEQYILKRVRSLAKNVGKSGDNYYQTKDGKRTLEQLQQFGIDGITFSKEFLENGNIDALADQLKLGKLRFVDNIIFPPQVGNRPLVRFSRPSFKLVSQLGSFPVLFGNTVFPRMRADIIKKFRNDPKQATINALKATEAVAVMSGVAYLAMNIKGIAKMGYEKWEEQHNKKSNKEKMVDAINAAGWLGQFSPISGMALATKYGEHPAAAIIGPAADWGFDIVKGGFQGEARGSFDPLVKPVVKSIPVLSSTPQLADPIIESIKESVP